LIPFRYVVWKGEEVMKNEVDHVRVIKGFEDAAKVCQNRHR
jgi:hypothetical protein